MRTARYVKTIILAGLCLTISGTSACDNYVGVEWVQDYDAVGKHEVSGRKACAQGFYETIIDVEGWKGRFNKGNADAWEEHFKREAKGGTDTDWIDKVDFAYFAGHGAGESAIAGPTGVGRGGGFTFGNDEHDDWVLSAIPSNREPEWGDGRLEWIVLDVCSALALKEDGDGVQYTLCERWANSGVMNGLHYILGFRTAALDSAHRGGLFARYLTGKEDGIKYTIRDAWRKATEDTESSWYEGAYLRASSPGANTYNDHLYECGPVSKDPDPGCQCYCYLSWPCS